MTQIVYQNQFVFNPYKYFSELFDQENIAAEQKEKLLPQLATDETYLFVYEKHASGSWYRKCYRDHLPVSWDEVAFWMREHIWAFEKEHRIFHF